MAEENLNLYQKLAKIRKMADVVQKSKRGYNYSYSDISDILAKVTAGMDKYGVSLIPGIVPGTTSVSLMNLVSTKATKTGEVYETKSAEYLFKADMTYTWVDDDNPESQIVIPWSVAGSQADPSQAGGSGLTYGRRQFLVNYFQIAETADSDPDAYRSKQKEAAAAENKAIAEEIISAFDSTVRQYLADNQDKAEDVKKFISKYAKNANYSTIKDPVLAAKLVEDFNSKYIK